jgi:hypothetical protein
MDILHRGRWRFSGESAYQDIFVDSAEDSYSWDPPLGTLVVQVGGYAPGGQPEWSAPRTFMFAPEPDSEEGEGIVVYQLDPAVPADTVKVRGLPPGHAIQVENKSKTEVGGEASLNIGGQNRKVVVEVKDPQGNKIGHGQGRGGGDHVFVPPGEVPPPWADVGGWGRRRSRRWRPHTFGRR